jgi:hypothetical protein
LDQFSGARPYLILDWHQAHKIHRGAVSLFAPIRKIIATVWRAERHPHQPTAAQQQPVNLAIKNRIIWPRSLISARQGKTLSFFPFRATLMMSSESYTYMHADTLLKVLGAARSIKEAQEFYRSLSTSILRIYIINKGREKSDATSKNNSSSDSPAVPFVRERQREREDIKNEKKREREKKTESRRRTMTTTTYISLALQTF